ncbi:MAG: ABC transporter, partial [Acidimicrobiia bacterium]
MPVTDALVAEAVTAGWGGVAVVEDVTFRIAPGEFVALVGPNGSGKSTLVRALLGLHPLMSGSVRLFGEDPRRLREPGRLGYVPQRPGVHPDLPATVTEVVAAGRLARTGWLGRFGPRDHAEIDHAIESVGLGPLRRARVAELSGGQQQRAFIARAFAAEPELLVLDEPVAGVDRASQERFRDALVHLVRGHGAAVLLVSHELGAVADALDRVIVLKGRVVFDGAPSSLVASGVSLGVHPEDLPLWLEDL